MRGRFENRLFELVIVDVPESKWLPLTQLLGQPIIHPADAQVFVVAQESDLRTPVLTDDLALRQRLDSANATSVGTIGILIRAYKQSLFSRQTLDSSIDALFTISTLHASRAFRAYIEKLLADLE